MQDSKENERKADPDYDGQTYEDIKSIGLTLRGAVNLTTDRDSGNNAGQSFVSIAAKWLASGTDDETNID